MTTLMIMPALFKIKIDDIGPITWIDNKIHDKRKNYQQWPKRHSIFLLKLRFNSMYATCADCNIATMKVVINNHNAVAEGGHS